MFKCTTRKTNSASVSLPLPADLLPPTFDEVLLIALCLSSVLAHIQAECRATRDNPHSGSTPPSNLFFSAPLYSSHRFVAILRNSNGEEKKKIGSSKSSILPLNQIQFYICPFLRIILLAKPMHQSDPALSAFSEAYVFLFDWSEEPKPSTFPFMRENQFKKAKLRRTYQKMEYSQDGREMLIVKTVRLVFHHSFPKIIQDFTDDASSEQWATHDKSRWEDFISLHWWKKMK